MPPPITVLVLTHLGAFLLGIALGYLYSGESERSAESKAKVIITVTITSMWVVAMIADIFITGYAISPLVHAIMGAVVGYFFADEGFNVTIGG